MIALAFVTGHRVAKQLRLPAGTERTDVTLEEVVVDWPGAIVDASVQVLPMVARIANRLAEQAFRQYLRRLSSSQALNASARVTLYYWRSP